MILSLHVLRGGVANVAANARQSCIWLGPAAAVTMVDFRHRLEMGSLKILQKKNKKIDNMWLPSFFFTE